jgi:hypothetical protein
MNEKRQRTSSSLKGKYPAFWRSSLYEEPTWVALAWIVGPALIAGIAIYFAVR